MSAQPAPPRPHLWWLIGAGCLLAWHASAGPHLYDAGELVAAAFGLGGAHAPGQPLHALAGHAATLIPLGPLPYRLALLSVITSVAAAHMAGRLAGAVVERAGLADRPAARWVPDAAALATLLSQPVMRQAGRVEVYGLAVLLALAALDAILRWGAGGPGAGRALRVAGLYAGLAGSVHPPTALATVAAGAAVLLVARRDVLRRPRALGFAATMCVLGLLTYAYLPVRARAGAAMWGEPTTWSGFVDYVTAAAYRQNLGGGERSLLEHGYHGLAYVAWASGLLPVLGLGLLWHARRHGTAEQRRAVAATLVAVPATCVAAMIIGIDEEIPDMVAYAAAPVALLIAAGAAGLVCASPAGRRATVATAALLALAANGPALPHLLEAVDQDVPALESLAGALVDTPPPRSLVVVRSDFVAAAWMMARETDGARPDVALLVSGLATSSWHWRSLARHPAFDGTPARAEGADLHWQYTHGAMRLAIGKVAIAIGPDAPVDGPGTVAGPYRLLPASGVVTDAVCERCTGERVARYIGDDSAAGPGGDRGGALAVLRDYEASRARRLLARGRTALGLTSIRRAVRGIPEDERRLLDGVAATQRRATPPTVEEPGTFMLTREEAVRLSAALLWSVGEEGRASALLAGQLDRGEPRALLQLGWLRHFDGDDAGAREALAAFVSTAPELQAETSPLSEALRAGATE